MHERIFGVILAAAVLLLIFELLRRQRVKEKYLVLWLLVALAIVVVAIYPPLIDDIAEITGIKAGPNVILLVGGLVVTLVCVHMSVEISRLEDRSRALAEEVGLLRLELEKAERPPGR